MNTRSILVILAACCILGVGCGGDGVGVITPTELSVQSFIEGFGSVEGGSTNTFTIEVTGDTGITYQWSVAPQSAGTLTNPTSGTTQFIAGLVAQDLVAVIQIVVNSDHCDPVVLSHEIIIERAQLGTLLNVSGISGLATLDPGGTATYVVEATGDDGITYNWSVDPESAGTLTPSDEASSDFQAAYGYENYATIQVVVNSQLDGPIERTHEIVIGTPPGPGPGPGTELTIGDISGPLYVDENTTVTYELTASGDTGITYQWSTYEAGIGSFDTPQAASTDWTAPEVTEYTHLVMRCEVDSDNTDPVIKTHQVVIRDVPVDYTLEVSEIDGPETLNEGTQGVYSVTVTGDTGKVYAWSCSPDYVGEFLMPDNASTGFRSFQVDEDTQVTLRMEVSSDHCGPIVKTMDVTILDVFQPPVAAATANPIPALVCEDINFTDDGSNDPDGGEIELYEWDWDNDGEYDENGDNVYHSWDQPGVYHVGFRVTDDEGISTELEFPLMVAVENALPTAIAEYEIIPLGVGDPIHFTAVASHDNDCEGQAIVNWEWDWNGDGVFDESAATVYPTYDAVGTYYVQLRVTDDEGAFDLLDEPLEIVVE